MRVLHVISGIEPENGGPTVALCGLVRSLTGIGVECEIVATWKSESAFGVAEALRTDGVRVTILGPTRRPFRRHRNGQSVLVDAVGRASIVHIHAVWEDIQYRAARVAKHLHKPYIWTPHGLIDRWNMKRNRVFKEVCLALYLKRALNHAAAIHAASEFERDQIARYKLRPPVIVQGFGVDDRLFELLPPRGAWRSANGFSEDQRLVVFLGRIQRGKGLEYLIPAMAEIQRPSVDLIIAGPDEGGYRAVIERLVQKHALTGRVHFAGMVHGEDKVALLNDADVLAAPSDHESFGIAVAEALVVGTGVVVSDQVGLAPFIARSSVGCVAPNSSSMVCRALSYEICRSSEQRRQTIRAAASEWFRWSTVARSAFVMYNAYVAR